MSAAEAKPDSSILMADSRYGTSSAFTTKPARSWDRIAFFPSTSPTKAAALTRVCSSVSNDGTSSTSAKTGTGLKKWIPIT